MTHKNESFEEGSMKALNALAEALEKAEYREVSIKNLSGMIETHERMLAAIVSNSMKPFEGEGS